MPAHMRPAKGTATRERRARARQKATTLTTNAARVRAREGGLCRVCYQHGTEVHHIVFRSQGGTNDTGNLILLCLSCHWAVHARRLWIGGDADRQLEISKIRLGLLLNGGQPR